MKNPMRNSFKLIFRYVNIHRRRGELTQSWNGMEISVIRKKYILLMISDSSITQSTVSLSCWEKKLKRPNPEDDVKKTFLSMTSWKIICTEIWLAHTELRKWWRLNLFLWSEMRKRKSNEKYWFLFSFTWATIIEI